LSIIKKLNRLLTNKDKELLLKLLFFSIFISLLETIGISVIMPFIQVANDFTLIDSNQYYNSIYNYFHFEKKSNFVVLFGILLILFYIFRSGINLLYFYFLNRFSQGRYHLLAYRLFENYTGMSYRDYIDKNSSNLTKTIISEASNLTNLITALLLMLSEVFVIIFIYAMMLYVNYKITILLTILLGLNAILLTKTISKMIKKAGERRAGFQKQFYEIINSTLGNFKIIKLKSNDKQILSKFSKASYGYAKSNIINGTLSQFPRLFLEAIGFSIVIFIVIYLVYKYQNNVSELMALISMFILALYRLMPSVNRIMNSYNKIMFLHKSLDIVHNDLIYNAEELGEEEVNFNQKIELQNILFYYNKDNIILDNINLIINKGESIAFIGESGSGKSTLVDIIIGLYKPINGNIYIDDKKLTFKNLKSWRKKIGYIPQSVYLFDGTVAQNVAFEEDNYDENRIKDALKKANILDFLEKNQDGIETKVGEGGIKLSGGQKQRIAIARALYDEPEILVLDEATSALDNETEAKIMEEIYDISKDKTLIIIAHRLSTIQRCNKIYKIRNGKIYNE